MFTRIRYVFLLSIASIVVLVLGQGYWLLNQYRYSTDDRFRLLQVDCEAALERETALRHQLRPDSLEPAIVTVVPDGDDEADAAASTSLMDSLVSATRKSTGRDVQVVNMAGIKRKYHARVVDQYGLAQFMAVQPQTIDSLLRAVGYGGIGHFEITKHREGEPYRYEPEFTMKGGLMKGVHVEWDHNPLADEALSFDVRLTANSALRSMGWQLAGTLAMVALLVACLVYQIRTIVIQRRIDNIRREYMKNMFYEMKTPKADLTPITTLRQIGDTTFDYDQNELQRGTNRVIITSRQAEILRMLADSEGRLVPREQVLRQIWGDDSPANANALSVQLTYLRRALSMDPRLSIETVSRKGVVLRVK